MTRTVDANLLTALANQQGSAIIRVNTWTDLADYNANPAAPDHVWVCIKFDIFNTRASATLITANNYALSDFTVFTIERGVNLAGVEYTIESGLMFLRDYQENYGTIKITGSSYPNIKISIAGDDTYQNVITAFCTAIGKTAVFKIATDPWLAYKFLPPGKTVSLNKAETFENMLRQKMTILVYEESPKNLVFYTPDSFETTAFSSIAWSPTLGLFCAVATDGTVHTSPDAQAWTQQTATEANNWTSVTWSPTLGLFCAVSSTGTNRVMTSPDGETWTAHAAAEANNWTSVTWSPTLGLFCAVAATGTNRVMTSPTGTVWTARAAAEANSWQCVTWSPELGLFCAVAQDGTNRVMISANGTAWTAEAAAEANPWKSVTWSPALTLFCAVSSLGTNRVMTSPNGTVWTARAAAEASLWKSVIWSPELGLFCAVATSGTNRAMISTNGTAWTAETIEARQWQCVTWSPDLGLFCAVANDGTNRITVSEDGEAWQPRSNNADWNLSYLDGPKFYLDRSQAEVHYLWIDNNGTVITTGDTTKPQWHLGYIDGDGSPPTTLEDPFYKFFLQKAPLRLDITDGDKIHFTPYWSIDPTKTIDAMCQVSEHFDTKAEPTWYQEIKSIVMFDSVEGGAMPSTIERVANYTPLNTTNFDNMLSTAENNVQAAMDKLDDHEHLAYNTATVTTGNVAAVSGNFYDLTIAGLTADRDFNLPTPAAAGEKIGLRILDGDDTYELVIKANATEITRVFIAGETMEFMSHGTGAGDWKISQDGRIPCFAKMDRITTNANTTNAASTPTTVDWNNIPINRGNIADITNDRFNIRRAGNYEVTFIFRPYANITDQKFISLLLLGGAAGTTQFGYAVNRVAATGAATMCNIPSAPVVCAVGDQIIGQFSTEEANIGMLRNDAGGVSSGGSWIKIKEVL